MKRRTHTFVSNAGLVVGRSFCPFFAIAIIAGAMLWGPWVSLGITVLAFVTAMRFV
jgi:LytS/YehU family sensor histidine kinase